MGSMLGRRVVHFPNLPIKLLMPTTLNNIKEIALKTIPSASKIEIKRVLESLYGFEVEEVRTLNMEGKRKKRGGILIAKPDYKKAYVTLRQPLSLPSNLYPISIIEEEKRNIMKQSKSSVVEDGENMKSHWLDTERDNDNRPNKHPFQPKPRAKKHAQGSRAQDEQKTKFPWSNMRSWK